MDEFPPNAHNYREQPEQAPAKAEAPEKRVEKVIEGTVVRRKKTFWRRFKDTFLSPDALTVGSEYVIQEVMVPAFRDLVADSGRAFLDQVIYGQDRYYNRGNRSSQRGRGLNSNSTINYTRYSTNRFDDRPPFPPTDRRSPMSRRARVNHQFDDIILATRVEAEMVLDRLYKTINKYDVVTVGDLYDMLGETSEYTDDNWGWDNLSNVVVRHTRDGYMLDLPNPEPLDRKA